MKAYRIETSSDKLEFLERTVENTLANIEAFLLESAKVGDVITITVEETK